MKRHIKNALRILKAVADRDQTILANPSQPARKNCVNLHWWDLGGTMQNVGDALSPVVVSYLKERNGITTDASPKGTAHLYAIGSIIDGAYQNATVWGSGLLRGKGRYWWRCFRKLDIRCVRGPETRQALLANGYRCPERYGDPAILMPLIYQPQSQHKRFAYRVIPHMVYGRDYPNALSPLTDDWKSFIDGIVQSELVISSSLHGIILAEAYGIPAILLNDHDMNLFKYRDYYLSTGRDAFPVARSVQEALSMTPAELPDLETMQKQLMEAFPKDLWMA